MFPIQFCHWIAPTLEGVLLSFFLLLVSVAFNYIVDSYVLYAASAIAANTIVRSACGAAAPLFTLQMFKALGVGVGGSLIGAVASLLAIIPFLFWKYGKTIRERSKFAPTKPADFQNARASGYEGNYDELAVMTAYRAYAHLMYSVEEEKEEAQGRAETREHVGTRGHVQLHDPFTEWPAST